MTQRNKTRKSAALAIGATFVATMAASSFANAASTNTNPFAMNDLPSGYTQLAEEGKCGANKAKAKEAKCGANKAKQMDKEKEGKCGGNKPTPKPKEGKCGGSK